MTHTSDRLRQLMRTARQPATVLAPAVSLATRALQGEFWAETVNVRSTSGPDVTMVPTDDSQPPEDGAGALNRRRYQVTIWLPMVSPGQLIEAFRLDPNRFSPTDYAVFVGVPDAGLNVGDQTTVELLGPWDGPVTVTEVSDRHVRFETRSGHMEAGWIDFRTIDDDGRVVFRIESLARSGDPVFDALYRRAGIGKMVQTDMWVRVLEAAVRISGGTQIGRVFVDTTIFEGADL